MQGSCGLAGVRLVPQSGAAVLVLSGRGRAELSLELRHFVAYSVIKLDQLSPGCAVETLSAGKRLCDLMEVLAACSI
ncbi:hypothetical protein SRHO_G00276780 [Serrasalmus rhombeus]